MLFSSRDPEHRSHLLHLVRDVVEIVAIVLAGAWAFYVFIYENRIVPVVCRHADRRLRDASKDEPARRRHRDSSEDGVPELGNRPLLFRWLRRNGDGIEDGALAGPTNDPRIRDSLHTYFTLSKPRRYTASASSPNSATRNRAMAPNSNRVGTSARNTRFSFRQTDSICSPCTLARASQNQTRNRSRRGSSRASEALPT